MKPDLINEEKINFKHKFVVDHGKTSKDTCILYLRPKNRNPEMIPKNPAKKLT